uniref:(northern house mosquito) hypothetical protein n=2 Tax=Culex pipiens TaxID=7175 RepID=A0A8D8CP24_CULPI
MDLNQLIALYHGMDTAHLTIDELDHELRTRSMNDEASRSQKEQALHGRLSTWIMFTSVKPATGNKVLERSSRTFTWTWSGSSGICRVLGMISGSLRCFSGTRVRSAKSPCLPLTSPTFLRLTLASGFSSGHSDCRPQVTIITPSWVLSTCRASLSPRRAQVRTKSPT